MNNEIYNYHPVTGEYLSTGIADVSPLEADALLIPAYSTQDAPPATAGNEVAVFDQDSGRWSVMPDFRAVNLFNTTDGSPVNIVDIGPQPEDTTLQPRPSEFHDWAAGQWIFNVAKARASVLKAINAKRDQLTQNGGYPLDGFWFHSDSYSLSQQQGLILAAMQVQAAGGDMDAPLLPTAWKTMGGNRVPMTARLALRLLPAAMAQQGEIFDAAEAHGVAMMESPDPASYDYSGGWPQVFGE